MCTSHEKVTGECLGLLTQDSTINMNTAGIAGNDKPKPSGKPLSVVTLLLLSDS